MRSVLLSLFLLFSPLSFAKVVEIHQFDGGKAILTDEQCKNADILVMYAMLGAPAEVIASLKQGSAEADDGSIKLALCYADAPDDKDYWFVLDEAGNMGTLKKAVKV